MTLTLLAAIPVLNAREAAIALWLVAFVVWGLSRKEVRQSFVPVLRTFASPKVGGMVLFAVAYSAAVVYGFARVGYWDPSMLKDTVYWFVGVAFVALVNLAGKDERYLRSIVCETFELSAAIAFLVNLYGFPLYIELVLVPVTVFLTLSLVDAKSGAEFAPARKVLDGVLVVLGLWLVSYALFQAVTDWAGFASKKTVLTFLLLPLLTLAFIPFLYGFALVMAYELIFMRVRFARRDSGHERRTPMGLRWMILRACGFGLARVNRFTPEVMPRLFAAGSDAEAEQAIRSWRVVPRGALSEG